MNINLLKVNLNSFNSLSYARKLCLIFITSIF